MFKKENKKFSYHPIKNRKKAELTTQQIVIMIILITSFSIILIFLFTLDLGKTTDEQICHNSVIMASKNKLSDELNCKIRYTCISSKKGDCNNFNYNKKIEIEFNKNNIEETKKELSKVIASEMATCWWMFGEGKVDYAQDYKGMRCGICNEIVFGEKLQEEIKLSYKDFLIQLGREKKDNEQTYLQYLYGTKNINNIFNENPYIKENYNKQINLTKKYLILTGMDGHGTGEFGENKIKRTTLIKSSDLKETNCDTFDLTKP